MRPLRLELEGFGAFRERVTVDLSDADLFAIVGATGHGKSTLIDAICFTLYGKVPRHGARDMAPAMTLGANETKVSFTFELAGDTYVATRVLRRKATGDGVTTRGLRLEAVGPDGRTEVLAGAANEFQACVRRLIGLDFDQFTKCVVLPQGEFAAFLHASPGERVAILSALLALGRYDRMAAAARERAKRAAGQRDALAAERTRLGDVTPAALDAARARRDALCALRTEIEAAAPRAAEWAREAETAHADAGRARAAVAALASVRVPADMREHARAADEAHEIATIAAAEADAADARAAQLEAVAAALPPVEQLAAAVDAHAEREKIVARIVAGEESLHTQAATAEEAKAAVEAAERDLTEAQSAADDAQQHHAHAELRAELRPGEPCPVCEHRVDKLPPKASTAQLTKARKALDAARKALQRAEVRGRSALDGLAKANALLDTLRERLGELDRRVTEFPDPAAVAAQATEVRAAHEDAGAARRAATTARTHLQNVSKEIAGTDKLLRRIERAMQDQRDAVVSAGLEPPAADASDVMSTWTTLEAWAGEVLPDHEKRAAACEDRARARVAELDELLGGLAGRAAEVGVDARRCASVAELLAPVVGATRDADHAVELATERLTRAAELDTQVLAARETEQVAAEMGRLLDKAHFGQWLVDEALRGLVEGASALLEQLSGGQYALATRDDGELLVVDHVNADELRSVRSLSGGETFQASLALALALANRIASLAPEGAAALESIFLDEGFGSLDPETLDVVAGTIESLGYDERVIGVVTHVPELAERMPVRFRVTKQGRTATVTREET